MSGRDRIGRDPLTLSLSKGEPKVAFIGMGNVGTALANGLSEAGYAVGAVADAGIVFITTPDDAIAGAAAKVRWRPDQVAVHCSGAHSTALLEPARAAGAAAGVFHPLQTFPDRDGARRLAGCYAGIEGDERALPLLEEMARRLKMHPVRVPPGKKALYHVASVLVSNYVVTLAAEAAGLWERMGLGREEAISALAPLMRATVENLETAGPVAALTGPIARGDTGTIQRHIEALEEDAPALLPLYRTLASLTEPIAEAKRRR